MGMGLGGDRLEVTQIAEDVGVLDDDAGGLVIDLGEDVLACGDVRRQGHDLIAGHGGEGAHDLGVVRMQAARQQGLFALRHAVGHQHGLAGAGRAVIHRGVGDLHAGQRRDLRLELEEVLQRALRDLGLVGRVAGQEFRALDQMVHRGGDMVLVGAGPDEERHGRGRNVAGRHPRQDALDLELPLGTRQIDRRLQQLVGRHVGEQGIDIGDADAGQHVLAVGVGQGEIAHEKCPLSVLGRPYRSNPPRHPGLAPGSIEGPILIQNGALRWIPDLRGFAACPG